MNTHQANRYTQFITPFGGIIAFISFFMPWTGVVIRTNKTTASGFAWISYEPLIGIALVANLAIIGLSFYMIVRCLSWISKVLVFIAGCIGISVLLQEYLYFVRLLRETDIEITGEFGFWGTVIGFAVAVVGVFLTRAEKREKRSEMFVDERYVWFVAHAGGIGALACFFLPWRGFGPTSGFDLAKSNPLITIALIASVVIVVVNLYMLKRGTLWKSREPVFVSSGIGLGALLSHYIHYFFALNTVKKAGIELSGNILEFGSWGTVIGLIVAAVGMSLISTKNKNKQVTATAE